MALRSGCIVLACPRRIIDAGRDPDVQVTVAGDGARVVHLSGAWTSGRSNARGLHAVGVAGHGPAQISLWDLTQIQRFDHIGAMLVWELGAGAGRAGCIRQEHEIFFARAKRPEPSHPRGGARPVSAPARAGRGVWA